MKKQEKHLAVALQGGGSHGAFTWGVLDRFLEEENLQLDGFCGTSAGAMNATILAYGLHSEGKEKAKRLLYDFWKTVSEYASFSLLQPSWYDKYFGNGNLDYSPGYAFSEILNLFVSPYQVPFDYNPLRGILEKFVDFGSLKSCEITKLFICATNVRRGRARVFKTDEVTVDAVLASACLPFMFKAVTIDGEDYWDGGYMGNPPIYPLIDGTRSKDILVVQINPINIPRTPKTTEEIRDRVNELSFNSSLMLEMRKIDLVDRMMHEGINYGGRFREIFFHNINPEVDLHQLNTSSKLNASWEYLLWLKDLGRKYADEWLNLNYDKIGIESTCNIRETFL